MASFEQVPRNAKTKPVKFTVNIPQRKLDELKTLLKLAKIAPQTYEATQDPNVYGVTREWLLDIKTKWEKYDWKKTEARINTFPNFILPIKHGSCTIDIHFVALFSRKNDALPLLLLHGWPGSFLEFLPMLSILSKTYTSETLPYHVIVPSYPGYSFSSGTPLDCEFSVSDTADMFHELLYQLGLGDSYVIQAGDIGSRVGRIMGVRYPKAVMGVHLNFCLMSRPQGLEGQSLTLREEKGVKRLETFMSRGAAYSMEHCTRPATIGFVLQASPLSLLAWVGEKYLTWVDKPLPTSVILDSLSLYWLTETIARSLYVYRTDWDECQVGGHGDPDFRLSNFGYSGFPMEIAPIPRSWIEQTGNLVFYREHDEGGHFAAMECPRILLHDLEEYVQILLNG